MQWIITKDHIGDLDEKTRVGYGNYKGEPNNLSIRFKLYDDDGELCYEGRCSEEDFAPLDWAMNDAGCTEMKTSKGRAAFTTL